MCLYKKKERERDRVSAGFRVDRVFPGQLPGGFLLRPGPVPSPGRPGPGSTRRAGLGFKTVLKTIKKKINPKLFSSLFILSRVVLDFYHFSTI
jgi:hypothetical protein